MLLQVLDLLKSKAVAARDEATERLRVAASERDEAQQQLADLRSAHEAALEAASAHEAARDRCRSSHCIFITGVANSTPASNSRGL